MREMGKKGAGGLGMGREGVELLILHYEGFVRAIEDEPLGEREGGWGGGKEESEERMGFEGGRSWERMGEGEGESRGGG